VRVTDEESLVVGEYGKLGVLGHNLDELTARLSFHYLILKHRCDPGLTCLTGPQDIIATNIIVHCNYCIPLKLNQTIYYHHIKKNKSYNASIICFVI
jgi:hypothetical protein